MKFQRMSKTEAENIIVKGFGGFSILTIADVNTTIYHRLLDDKYYEIGEMEIYIAENDETITQFYQFDPEEIKQMLGFDPQKTTREDWQRNINLKLLADKEIEHNEKLFYDHIKKYQWETESLNNIKEINCDLGDKDLLMALWHEIYVKMVKQHPELNAEVHYV